MEKVIWLRKRCFAMVLVASIMMLCFVMVLGAGMSTNNAISVTKLAEKNLAAEYAAYSGLQSSPLSMTSMRTGQRRPLGILPTGAPYSGAKELSQSGCSTIRPRVQPTRPHRTAPPSRLGLFILAPKVGLSRCPESSSKGSLCPPAEGAILIRPWWPIGWKCSPTSRSTLTTPVWV